LSRFAAISSTFLLCQVISNLSAQPQPVSFAQSPQFAVPLTATLLTADFNGDGRNDLLVTSTVPTSSLLAYLGDGQGGFQPVTTPLNSPPHGVIAANFNGDRYPDLAVCHSGSVEILLGNGDGTFRSVSSITLPYPGDETCRYMTSTDLNGDGFTDLVIPTDPSVLVYLGNGAGQFTQKSAIALPGVPGPVLTGMFHTGKTPDIVAFSGSPFYSPLYQMYLLSSNGDGTFQAPVAISPDNMLNCAVGDFNHDGNLDLACAGQLVTTYAIYLGNGDGSFRKPQFHETPYGILSLQTTDLDGDGNLDLILEFGSWCVGPCTPSGTDTMAVAFGKGNGTFSAPDYFAVGDQALTAVAADFNSDGNTDLAALMKGSDKGSKLSGVTMLFGTGNRRFRSPRTYSQRGSFQMAAADFNGDGNLDLAAFDINTPYGISMLPGRGNGTFGTPVYTATSVGLSFGGVADFNNDGKMDVWAQDANLNIEIFLGDGKGGFQKVDTIAIQGSNVLVADVNNDGIPDLLIQLAPLEADSLQVLLGRGDGTFQPQISACSSCVLGCVGDFNGDGIVDLIAFSGSGSGTLIVGTVYLGAGDGTFQAGFVLPVGYNPPVTAADLNGDGKLDLVLNGPTSVLLGNGDGTFSRGPSQPNLGNNGASFLVADWNGDGIPDVATFYNSQVVFFLGTGNANFVGQSQRVPFSALFSVPGVLFGDFNNDGKPDVAILDQLTRVSYVLLNTTP